MRKRICGCWMVLTTVGVSLTLGGGCDAGAGRAGGPGRESFQKDATSRLLLDTELDAVQPVALRTFREHFQVDTEASSKSLIVSRPRELTGQDHRERVRDMLRPSPNRRRELAALDLRQEGPHVRVRCAIQIQRQDTSERQVFAGQRGDDRPHETPIDREGALATTPREQWVNVGRDRQLELEILDEIQGSLTGATRPAGQ